MASLKPFSQKQFSIGVHQKRFAHGRLLIGERVRHYPVGDPDLKFARRHFCQRQPKRTGRRFSVAASQAAKFSVSTSLVACAL
jgi:hypothetical protein